MGEVNISFGRESAQSLSPKFILMAEPGIRLKLNMRLGLGHAARHRMVNGTKTGG